MWDVAIDWRVLAFAAVATGLVALAVGLTSAARAIRLPAVVGLRDEGTRVVGRQRGRAVLVTAEVAVSVVLLTAAVLIGQSYVRLASVERGFDSTGRLTAEVTAPLSIWGDDDALRRFFDDTLARALVLPGVTTAGAVTRLPFTNRQSSSGFGLVSNPADESDTGWSLESDVTPGYFDAMGIRLVRGRFLGPEDTAAGPRAVVINERLARNFFADRDPIGETIWERLDDGEIVGLEIVGVVGDHKHASLREEVEAKRYRPFSQRPAMQMTLVLRADGDAAALAASVRAGVRAVDPLATVGSVATMDGLVASSTALPRFRALMVATLATMAVVLALIGVYGVIAFAVADRTREIGVRISLGARRADLLRHVLGGGLWMIVPGVIAGTVAALAAGRLLERYLFQVTATDPAILAGVAVVVCALALVAVLMPARRASRVDPLIALRE